MKKISAAFDGLNFEEATLEYALEAAAKSKAACPPKSNADYWMPKLDRNIEQEIAQQLSLELSGWRLLSFGNANYEKTVQRSYPGWLNN